MFRSVLIWIATIASIVGIALYLIDRFQLVKGSVAPKYVVWGLIAGGVLLAIILGITEKTGRNTLPKLNLAKNQANIESNEGNVNIDQIGDRIIGDTTTTAKQRGEAALAEIEAEIIDNFKNLSSLIGTMEALKPERFWDVRRANETEVAYQDRAKAAFQQYQHEIRVAMSRTNFTNAVYQSYRRELSVISPKIVERIKNTYDHLNEVAISSKRYEDNLVHLFSLQLDDDERTNRNISTHREAVTNTKIAILSAAAQYCLVVNDESMIHSVSVFLNLANLQLNLAPGREGYSAAMMKSAELAQQKVEIFSERIAPPGNREVSNEVTDPYLLMLRKLGGLGEHLSEAELAALRKKEINTDESDPQKLFEMAAFSYLELDGHAAKIYFERAIKSGKLSRLQKRFAELSIHRVDNPEIYIGSIGVMVVKTTQGGNFENAGLVAGDVLVSVDGETINEPMEIASALAKSGGDPVLLGVIRDGKFRKVVVKSGESAGAGLSQLIILNIIQL